MVSSSQDVLKDLRQFYDTKTKGFVLRFCSSIDQAWLEEDPRPTLEKYGLHEPFLLCCNQFWAHKDHLTLFRAFGKLLKSGHNCHLVCTGNTRDTRNPDYFPKLVSIIEAMGLKDRVHIPGFLPRKDQLQLMRASLAVIQPSLFEGWSTVIEDARMLGKTVIYSDLAVHLEQNPDYGFAFKAGDANDLNRVMSDAGEFFAPTQFTDRERLAGEKNRAARLRFGEDILAMMEAARRQRLEAGPQKEIPNHPAPDNNLPGIFSHATAKLPPRKIQLKDGCRAEIGAMSIIEGNLVFEREGGFIRVGSRTSIGGATKLLCATRIEVGDDVLISFEVIVADHDSHSLHFSERCHDVEEWYRHRKDWKHVNTAPVIIQDKAWIGMRAIILKGVTIGEGAVVGAGSVVTRDIPPYTVAAGNPARIIRKLDEAPVESPSTSWDEAVRRMRASPGSETLVREHYLDDPLLEAAERYRQSEEWRHIHALLQKTPLGKALDMGAGRGIVSYALAREGWEVTALEPDPGPVAGAGAADSLAADSRLPFSVVRDYGETLPFRDEEYSLVVARHVLYLAQDLQRFCSEMYRVLKPAGKALIIRTHVVDDARGLKVFLNQHPLYRHYKGGYAFSLDTYMQAFQEAGFQVDRVLNPLETPLNTYPLSEKAVRRKASHILGVADEMSLSEADLRQAGARIHDPGRLYSFILSKPDREGA